MKLILVIVIGAVFIANVNSDGKIDKNLKEEFEKFADSFKKEFSKANANLQSKFRELGDFNLKEHGVAKVKEGVQKGLEKLNELLDLIEKPCDTILDYLHAHRGIFQKIGSLELRLAIEAVALTCSFIPNPVPEKLAELIRNLSSLPRE